MDFQSEQKKFLQQHKTRSETYSKAAATMKKQRKKSRAANKSGLAMDKELKNMQILEEEKTKLDAFCEQSLKNVSRTKSVKLSITLDLSNPSTFSRHIFAKTRHTLAWDMVRDLFSR